MSFFHYKAYMLCLLMVIATLNFLDRYVLSLALEPIKNDLKLTDGEIGILTGLSFAFFYAVAGIPLARWADTGNRNTVISFTTSLWGVMLILCGLVTNFTQLLFVRIGVAVGEAGCLPSAQSLIAEYFGPSELPRAMALYWASGPVSLIIGFSLGGWVIENYGWRAAFIGIGFLSAFVALLVKITLREPRLSAPTCNSIEQQKLQVVIYSLWSNNTYRQLSLAFCVGIFYFSGTITWIPTFFRRTHGMETLEIGSNLALVYGVGGIFGALVAGYTTRRFFSNKESLQMKIVSGIYVSAAVLYMAVYLVSSEKIALLFMLLAEFILAMCTGVTFAVIQSVIEDRVRALAIAIILLASNLLGMGLGPLAVGVLSDLFEPQFGGDSLRYSLLFFTPGMFWVAFHFWRISHNVEADMLDPKHNEGETFDAADFCVRREDG